MSTETTLSISGLDIHVVRKAIKHLHLSVEPPAGRVRVAAPRAVSDDAIRAAVVQRLRWIRQKQAKFVAQERQGPREYVTGESHYYLGQRYRLVVVPSAGPAGVALRAGRRLELQVPPTSAVASKGRVLDRWYRARLAEVVAPLVTRWEKALDVAHEDWTLRRMKNRWGTCAPTTGRLTFNVELVKKPRDCIEFIVVHELAHLLVRTHDERFRALMDRHLPRWRQVRTRLNAAPLGHEDWTY